MENTRMRLGLSYASAIAMAGLALLPKPWEGIASVVFGILCVLLLLASGFNKPIASGNAKLVRSFFLIWLIWSVVATIGSPDLPRSFQYTLHLGALAIGGFVLGLKTEDRLNPLRIFLSGLIMSALTLNSLAWFPKLAKASSYPFFQDANFLSAAIALLLPMLAALAWSERRRWIGWATLAMVLLLIAGVIIFRSRGAWLSLIAVGLAAPVYLMTGKKWRIAWLVFILLLAVGYFGFRISRPPATPTTRDTIGQLKSIGEINTDFSNRERLMRWECAWRMAIERPLLGQGPGLYPSIFNNYLKNREEVERISYWFGWRFGGHSDSFTILGETGFVGFLAFAGMILALGTLMIRRTVNQESGFTLKAGIALGLLSWVIHGCFNDLLTSSFLAVWGFWMIGYLLQPDSERVHPKAKLT